MLTRTISFNKSIIKSKNTAYTTIHFRMRSYRRSQQHFINQCPLDNQDT